MTHLLISRNSVCNLAAAITAPAGAGEHAETKAVCICCINQEASELLTHIESLGQLRTPPLQGTQLDESRIPQLRVEDNLVSGLRNMPYIRQELQGYIDAFHLAAGTRYKYMYSWHCRAVVRQKKAAA